MPQGPAGGPRPLSEAFQSIEFGVFDDIPADEAQRAGNKMQDIFGTEGVGTITSESIEGGFLVLPLDTHIVYVDDITQFLDEKEAETIADTIWNVKARVQGKGGTIRPFAEADQKVTIFYSTIPEEALNYTDLAEEAITDEIVTRQASNVIRDEIKSVEADYTNNRVHILFDRDSIDNGKMIDIKGGTRGLPRPVSDKVFEEVVGTDPNNMEGEDFRSDEFDDAQKRINAVEQTQIKIEAV